MFSEYLSELGITIISGMAKGIDTMAHKSAIATPGNTIAVLGSGFENIFPEENKDLFIKIIENGGLIISEYAPKEPPQSKNFPKRNRIVTGLSSRSTYC